jgi:2,3-dihydroxybiphenyl 1,2-dioxygenase
MTALRNLSYVIVAASDLDTWENYASNIIGLAVASRDATHLGLRMDAEPWRIRIERGEDDDLTHAGWEIGSADLLDDYITRLREKGENVRQESDALAASRCVDRLFSLADPNGFQHEFFGLRLHLDTSNPSSSAVLRGEGFKVGDLGIGHILPVSKDYDASVRWYQDVLGLRYSDRIRQEMAPGIFADATFFHTATGRHHSLATGAFPSAKRLNHLMLEYQDMNDVGAAYDRAVAADIPIILELGHHPNDQAFSFYMKSPSGFGIELAHGGIVIDDNTWEPQIYPVMSDWGHKRRINTID